MKSSLPGPPDLLACPFDGEPAAVEHDSGSWGYLPKTIRVYCPECATSSPKFEAETWAEGRGTLSIHEEALAAAVAWWNRRPSLGAKPTS